MLDWIQVGNHNLGLDYICNLCRHPFDSSKWGRICQFLISDGALDKKCIVEPLEASKDDLLVVMFIVSLTWDLPNTLNPATVYSS